MKKYLHEDVFKNFPFLLTEVLSPKKASPEFYKKVEEIYLLIYRAYNQTGGNRFRIISHLLSILLLYIKEYFWEDYNPIYDGNRKSQIVKSFKQMLELHYRDLGSGRIDMAYRVQDYAIEQQLNPSYLSAVIKAKTGKSIQSWIADKTILLAKAMLQNTECSIKEISFKLGFSETAHFSNYFKKQTGNSPTLYRKNILDK